MSNPTILCMREKEMGKLYALACGLGFRPLAPVVNIPSRYCSLCCQSTLRDWPHSRSRMGQGGQAHIFSSPRWRCGGARDGYKCRFVEKRRGYRVAGLVSLCPPSGCALILFQHRRCRPCQTRCIYLQGRLPAPPRICLTEPPLYIGSACAHNLY